jgi:hypothetical protein
LRGSDEAWDVGAAMSRHKTEKMDTHIKGISTVPAPQKRSAVNAPTADFTDCGWNTNNCAADWVKMNKKEKYR